jgi:2-hydroxychromene-2-carboxylate isomerase
MEPKHAALAAVSQAGGADGKGMNANAHHPRVDASHSARTRAGSVAGWMGYPTFQRNDRIFQFAK